MVDALREDAQCAMQSLRSVVSAATVAATTPHNTSQQRPDERGSSAGCGSSPVAQADDDNHDGEVAAPKRKQVAETQFGGDGAHLKGLVKSYCAYATEDKLREALEDERVWQSTSLQRAKINYSLNKTRSSLVEFHKVEHVSRSRDLLSAVAKALRSKSRRRGRREIVDPATSSCSKDRASSGEGREKNEEAEQQNSDDEDDQGVEPKNTDDVENGTQNEMLKRLDAKLDNSVMQASRAQKSLTGNRKQAWSGWTVKRIVERKQKIAELLEAKAHELEQTVQTKKHSSSTSTRQAKSKDQKKAPELFRKALANHKAAKTASLAEAVKIAHAAAAEAQRKADLTFGKATGSGGNSTKYLKQRHKPAALKRKVPQQVRRKHPKLDFSPSRNEKRALSRKHSVPSSQTASGSSATRKQRDMFSEAAVASFLSNTDGDASGLALVGQLDLWEPLAKDHDPTPFKALESDFSWIQAAATRAKTNAAKSNPARRLRPASAAPQSTHPQRAMPRHRPSSAHPRPIFSEFLRAQARNPVSRDPTLLPQRPSAKPRPKSAVARRPTSSSRLVRPRPQSSKPTQSRPASVVVVKQDDAAAKQRNEHVARLSETIDTHLRTITTLMHAAAAPVASYNLVATPNPT
ncbi:unnamed protein product [Durusdinium trenchii]|uniref:Uncharacterized protein n=1 Tax=Durusdinium trenchii TaxID=1381693 RepID=A0ABP0RPR4_9DINO